MKEEAESLKIFDKIILFTDKDLPESITNHPLYNMERGGGYWLWKPYIILEILSRIEENDILVYVDAVNCSKIKNGMSGGNLCKHIMEYFSAMEVL